MSSLLSVVSVEKWGQSADRAGPGLHSTWTSMWALAAAFTMVVPVFSSGSMSYGHPH